MKREALRELESMVQEQKRKQYPNVQEHCLPKSKFSDKNTNALTQAIIKSFELHGFFVTRIDSKGTYNQSLKRFIPSNQKKGLPDIMAQAAGYPTIWIEVKCAATKDRLKPHQEAVIEQLRQSGAIVFIATDYESFYQWFKTELINKTNKVV